MQRNEDKNNNIFLPICNRYGNILTIIIDPLIYKILLFKGWNK